MERSIEKRAEFNFRVGISYSPEQLVFVDECSADRRVGRGYGYALGGRRAIRKSFFVRGRRCVHAAVSFNPQLSQLIPRYSILPALSLDGILSLEIVEGSFTKLSFASFIDGLLDRMNPFPGPNSVIVMDNCRIHKSDLIQEMIEERCVVIECFVATHQNSNLDFFRSGMRCEFLPPYSPDFNPIELAFSAVKARLKRNHHHLLSAMGPGRDLDVYVALHEAVYSITAADAAGWFRHCSYI
jgi:transposase